VQPVIPVTVKAVIDLALHTLWIDLEPKGKSRDAVPGQNHGFDLPMLLILHNMAL
jgi:hypothetical protein